MKSFLLLSQISIIAFSWLSCGTTLNNEDKFVSYKTIPLESEITSVQPMTGIVYWPKNTSINSEAIQLEFSYMLYNDVCKEQGEYDWSVVDKVLDEIASRSHQAVLRFRYTYPGQETSVPDYIKARDDYQESIGPSEGRRTCFPDWRCEELQRFHLEFHRLFAARYDKDPRLAFVQIGFGLWGEYHIYDGIFIPGRTFPSKEFQIAFFQGLSQWYTDASWSISIDAADSKYSPFSEMPELLNIDFGNFDDSFMSEDHDGYNLTSWKFFGEERYKKSPFGGEFNYYSKEDIQHNIDKSGWRGRLFEDEVARFHMTYINGNDVSRYHKESRIKECSMSMGYKFRIDEYKEKSGEVAVLISNIGVAPIYRDAYVAVNGVIGDYSLKNLMPGCSEWIVIKVPESNNYVLSIECDHLVKGQQIQYEAHIK